LTDATLAALGFDEARAEELAALGEPALEPYRVVAQHRGHIVLHDGRMVAVGRALVRRAGGLATGDWVAVAPDGTPRHVLERRGALRRGDDEVIAANVDLALVMTSANLDLNVRRIERLLALARDGGAQARLILSKVDLTDDPEGAARVLGEQVHEEVLALCAPGGYGLDRVRALLAPGRTTVLLGSSGVGKSTLVNILLGEERQRTAEIRTRDDRGRHATTHRELFALPGGALILDTPGLRLPALAGDEGIAETFEDVEALEAQCRFANCGHTTEPGCAVRAAIEAGELDPGRVAARARLQEEAERAARRRAQRARR
jgi:ribosome biogenesis GTPase / thiamine phosphate phosphatase